jgi:hypothetical protein
LTTDFDSKFNSIATGQRKAVGVMSVVSALIALAVIVGVIAALVAIGSLVSGLMFNKFQKSMFS